MKDMIVAHFNRGNFTNMYALFDSSFTSKVSEQNLIDFLRGNQNSGKIINARFESEKEGMFTYFVEFELRNMRMKLKSNTGIAPEHRYL